MRVMGIDPGLATVGIGVIDAYSAQDIRAVDWMILQTAAGLPLLDRLEELQRDLRAQLLEHQPELVVVEKLFFATNARTAIDVAQARGALLVTLAEIHVPLLEPTPLQLKSSITGDGQASKEQVQDMMMRMLKLTAIPRPDDAADALALAVYGALCHQSALIRRP